MRGLKTSKGHHASLVGIALATILAGTALPAQQIQQQEDLQTNQQQGRQDLQRDQQNEQQAQQREQELANHQEDRLAQELAREQDENQRHGARPSPLPDAQQAPAEKSKTQQAPADAEVLHALLRRPLVLSSPAPIQRISEADSNIIDTVMLSPNQILINGKTPGRVSLTVWDATGQSQEFDINVDQDVPATAQQLPEPLPDPPVRAEAQKGKTHWLDWAVIASIALVAGVIFGARRQRHPHINKLDLQTRSGEPREETHASAPSATPHADVGNDTPVEEAITDALTGLKTRRYLMEALDEEWRLAARSGHPFSVIMLDLDGFKQVNERGGQAEGDRVLAAVATVLDARSRQSHVLARYRSDEFAILLPETNTHQAEILAERLRAALVADNVLHAHKMAASFGIATFPDHGRIPEEILKAAYSGIQLAKRCKGNCVKVVPPSHKPGIAERNERLLEAYLEAAVKGIYSATKDTGRGDSPTGPEPSDDGSRTDSATAAQIKPLLNSMAALAFAVEAKGPYMRGHSQAVSRLAARIATQLGLSPAEVEEIRLAGLFHDIGKLYVPESVCNKPDLLTTEEFEIMKTHAASGAKMLEPLNSKAIESFVLHHHERYDGKGFPDGLAGESIPLGARIVAVAECFHNMISDLPYKNARTFEDTLAELRRCSGTQFDPKVLTAFLDWLQIYNAPPKKL
jgi:diguanylate cyclase (GGDEF)-like protein/putative nucleotidyltransferase with HDIG domain